ncbi:unnamed protein product [Cunninghamella echinulata]
MATTAMEVDTPETKPNAPITGIIYPPPDIRNMVDKTAQFLSNKGPELEDLYLKRINTIHGFVF